MEKEAELKAQNAQPKNVPLPPPISSFCDFSCGEAQTILQ